VTEPTEIATATLEEARAHARAQAGVTSSTQPTIPATAATALPDRVRASDVLWDETIASGGYSAVTLPRGAVVRLTDLDGDACASVLLFNAANTAERINVADTVKVQWQAYLGAGALLLSDMGRVLTTIVADTSGRHDALCGCTNRSSAEGRYGDGAIWSPTPNARDLFVLAGAKAGLGRRDIAPNVNFFKGVVVGDDGALRFDGAPTDPSYVELRAEVASLLLVVNAPHPLDPRTPYPGTAIRITVWKPAPDDLRRARTEIDTPERVRAFENTDEYLRGSAV
jgi:uncharacterized protein